MIVYFGSTVTAQAAGRTWRAEQCEHCGMQFYYPVEMVATGSAVNPYFLDSTSAARAEQQAQDSLKHALEYQIVPVPCPHCSLYQKYMIPEIIASLFPGLKRIGLALLVAATPATLLLGWLISNLPGLNLGAAIFVLPTLCFASGLAALMTRARWVDRYDPNARGRAEGRRRLAAQSALTPEEFARLRAEPAPIVPPRSRGGQLVNQNCTRCGHRIPDELDSRFCVRCGSPVHNRCAVPAEGGCPACGTATRQP